MVNKESDRGGVMDLPQQQDGLWNEKTEWLRVTLASIGDAVITTDTEGRVTFLNPVAESLTCRPDSQQEG